MDAWNSGGVGQLCGAQEGEGRSVVACGSVADEFGDRVQDCGAEGLSADRGSGLKDFFDPVEAEGFRGTVGVALTFHHSAGDDQERCASFEGYRRGFAGGVGKEAERKTGRWEFRDAGAVPKKARSMSRVGVAEGPESFVIARDEGGTRAWAGADFQEATIQAEAEFSHRIGFVDVGGREQFGPDIPEDLLGGGEDVAVFVATTSDVEHADEDAFRTGADGVVEVSSDSIADKNGGDVHASDLWEDGGDRLDGDRGVGIGRVEARKHGEAHRKVAHAGRGSNPGC